MHRITARDRALFAYCVTMRAVYPMRGDADRPIVWPESDNATAWNVNKTLRWMYSQWQLLQDAPVV